MERNRPKPKPWLIGLNAAVLTAIGIQFLAFPKIPDWNANPPPYSGAIVLSDTKSVPQLTVYVVRWLDCRLSLPPCPGSDGNIYVASNPTRNRRLKYRVSPNVISLDTKTGRVLWNRLLESDWVDNLQYKDGLLQTRTQRWVERTTQVHWDLHKIDPGTGADRATETRLSPTTGVGTTLLYDNPFSQGSRQSMAGRDPVTGNLWSTSMLPPDECASFVSDGHGILYVMRSRSGKTKDSNLFALEARRARDGAVVWRFPFATGYSLYGPLSLSPNGKTLFFIGDDTRLTAVDTNTGKILWAQQTLLPGLGDDSIRLATGNQGVVIAQGLDRNSGDASLRAYDENTGQILWQSDPNPSLPKSSLSQVNPVIGPEGTVYAVSYQRMTACEGKTGKILWQVAAPQGYSISTDCAVSPEGTVYFGANSSNPDSRLPASCVIAVSQ